MEVASCLRPKIGPMTNDGSIVTRSMPCSLPSSQAALSATVCTAGAQRWQPLRRPRLAHVYQVGECTSVKSGMREFAMCQPDLGLMLEKQKQTS